VDPVNVQPLLAAQDGQGRINIIDAPSATVLLHQTYGLLRKLEPPVAQRAAERRRQDASVQIIHECNIETEPVRAKKGEQNQADQAAGHGRGNEEELKQPNLRPQDEADAEQAAGGEDGCLHGGECSLNRVSSTARAGE
jgi:hypothetical protein